MGRVYLGCGTEIIANGLDGGVRKKEESKDNFLVLGLSNQQCNNWERTGRSKFIVENQPFDLALACTCFGIEPGSPALQADSVHPASKRQILRCGPGCLIPKHIH